jgi:hypothetical protein
MPLPKERYWQALAVISATASKWQLAHPKASLQQHYFDAWQKAILLKVLRLCWSAA